MRGECGFYFRTVRRRVRGASSPRRRGSGAACDVRDARAGQTRAERAICAMTSNESEAASGRERLRRPLPQVPTRGSDPPGGAAAGAAAVAGVRGVVASRLAAMASAGSSAAPASLTSSSSATNGAPETVPIRLTASYSVDSSSRIPSYRLSSLDRLAQRQRLFESTPLTSTFQANGTAAASPAETAVCPGAAASSLGVSVTPALNGREPGTRSARPARVPSPFQFADARSAIDLGARAATFSALCLPLPVPLASCRSLTSVVSLEAAGRWVEFVIGLPPWRSDASRSRTYCPASYPT